MTTTRLLILLLLVALILAPNVNAANLFKGMMMGSQDDPGLNTCDSALAKSLVQLTEEKDIVGVERDEARENHRTALEEIGKLALKLATIEAALAASKEELVDYAKAVEDKEKSMIQRFEEKGIESQKWWTAKTEDMEKLHAEKEATLQQASDDTLELVQMELNVKIATLEDLLTKIEEEKNQALAAAKEEAEKAIAVKELEIADKHDQNQVELEAAKKEAYDVKLALIKEIEDKHEQNQVELEAAKKEAHEVKLALLKEKEDIADQLALDHDAQKRSLEEENNERLVTLKQMLETKEKLVMEQVTAKENAVEGRVTKIQQEAEKLLKDKEGHYTKELEKLVKSIKDMKKEHDTLEKKTDVLTIKYDTASREINEWQELYKARSYCNFTHMTEDTTAAVAKAGEFTTEKVSAVTEQLSAVAKVVSEKVLSASEVATEQISIASQVVSKATEPLQVKGRKLYDLHLKEHVDKHVWQHVKPALNVAGENIKEARNFVNQVYQRMIAEFKSTCPEMKSQMRAMKLHPTMLTYVKEKCKNPKETVDRFLLAILIVVALVFRRFVWRTLLFFLYLPFQIIWYTTPLALLFPRKKAAAEEAAPVAPENDDNSSPAVAISKFTRENVGPAQ